MRRKRIIIPILILCFTFVSLLFSCKDSPKTETETEKKQEALATQLPSEKPESEIYTPTPKPVLEEKEIPLEIVLQSPQTSEVPKTICTLSVRCDSVVENIDKLPENKRSIVPPDGIIYKEQTVEFTDGESVFDVLLREMTKNNIHFEFVKTPAYNSVYIEGIGNLYEFDLGDTSGWMYSVNGIEPRYGCSEYILKDGDKIEFIYSKGLY